MSLRELTQKEAAAEIERLRAALKEYGRHDPTCHWFHPERYACDCGLHAALEQKSPVER
jgi:hypothetical protein